MATDTSWRRIGWPAMLALVVAAGGAWAEDTAVSEGDGWISGDGVEGEMTVTAVEDESPISGDGVEGEITVTAVEERGEASSGGGTVRPEPDSELRLAFWAQAETRPNLCTSPEYYVDWLCEWQGYPQP